MTTSIWVECLGSCFDDSFDLLESAVRECPAERWDASMWDAAGDLPPGFDERFVARRSTPWSVAWHALECLDYDLSGDFVPWSAPPPFTDKAHWRDLGTLAEPWSQAEILGYIDECRQRVRDVLADLTDGKAATPLPATHRHHPKTYGRIVMAMPGHTIEHAAQIRQFVAQPA